MTAILLVALGVVVISFAAGLLLAWLEGPPIQPREGLVCRLWQARSVWRERR